MRYTKHLAGGAASVLVTLSLLTFAPTANADGPDLGRARNGVSQTIRSDDFGAARNDIGQRPAVPVNRTGTADTGLSARDAALGTLGGLVAVGGAAAALVTMRRRHPMAHRAA